VRTSSAAGRATSIMAAPPGGKVRSRFAAAVSMRPTRQRLIAERITASRSAEGGPPPSSRTPPHSICVDVHQGAIVMQPSPPVRACFRRSRTSTQCDLWRPGTVSDTWKVLPGKRTMRSMSTTAPRRHVVGPRPAGARPGPAWEGPSCSVTMTGHAPLHRAWTRRPRSGIRRASVARAAQLSSGYAATDWGTLASWTLMWW